MINRNDIVAPDPLPATVIGPLLSTGVASCVVASAVAALTGLGPGIVIGVGVVVGLVSIVVISDRLTLLPRH